MFLYKGIQEIFPLMRFILIGVKSKLGLVWSLPVVTLKTNIVFLNGFLS
jgi:hypothetical protein